MRVGSSTNVTTMDLGLSVGDDLLPYRSPRTSTELIPRRTPRRGIMGAAPAPRDLYDEG